MKPRPSMHPNAVGFQVREPTRAFLWAFRNRDGTVVEYPTGIDAYRKYVALYGKPEATRWRYRNPGQGDRKSATQIRRVTR